MSGPKSIEALPVELSQQPGQGGGRNKAAVNPNFCNGVKQCCFRGRLWDFEHNKWISGDEGMLCSEPKFRDSCGSRAGSIRDPAKRNPTTKQLLAAKKFANAAGFIERDPNLKNCLRNKSGEVCDPCRRAISDLFRSGKAANPESPTLPSHALQVVTHHLEQQPSNTNSRLPQMDSESEATQCQVLKQKLQDLLRRMRALESAKRSSKRREENRNGQLPNEVQQLQEPENGRTSARLSVSERLRSDVLKLQARVSELQEQIKDAEVIDLKEGNCWKPFFMDAVANAVIWRGSSINQAFDSVIDGMQLGASAEGGLRIVNPDHIPSGKRHKKTKARMVTRSLFNRGGVARLEVATFLAGVVAGGDPFDPHVVKDFKSKPLSRFLTLNQDGTTTYNKRKYQDVYATGWCYVIEAFRKVLLGFVEMNMLESKGAKGCLEVLTKLIERCRDDQELLELDDALHIRLYNFEFVMTDNCSEM